MPPYVFDAALANWLGEQLRDTLHAVLAHPQAHPQQEARHAA